MTLLTSPSLSTETSFAPRDRMSLHEGRVAMSGIDALLRVLVDQHMADQAKGLATAGLVCGYRGSPLAGVDSQYMRYQSLLLERDIHFINGVNEELAATVIWGSQLSSTMSGALFDGVMGMWYGKAPGVDRAGDAFRHANMSGTAPRGGVLCVAGDDPACKSSTVPSASEGVLAETPMPVLYPGSVQEVIDLGRWGYELSRASGLWVGFKIVTDVADAYSTVSVGPQRVQPEPDPTAWQFQQTQQLLPPWVLDIEREMREKRLAAAVEFARRNNLTHMRGAMGSNAWLGIVSAGKSYFDVCEALQQLGLDEAELSKIGIRIMKPAMIWPLEPTAVVKFAEGLSEIMVVEEKNPFIESQIRDTLYPLDNRPTIVGRTDASGKTLFPDYGFIEADLVVNTLREILTDRLGPAALPRSEHITVQSLNGEALPKRAPYYCSGCPHNRSNVTPEGSVTLGGIGCHSMSLFIPTRQVEGLTQMGGEGGTWVGAATFVSDEHRFQNIGDGTLYHSGSLAIRQAVASGVNITFKILYNSVVAMTGGQSAAGETSVPDLTMLLAAEGVRRTIVVADDIQKYPAKANWAPNVELRPRADVVDVQRELRDIKGTTALIYDQECAADLRKKRRRREVEAPSFRVVINERVCEGCGDCAQVSNCLSVFPVETEFGQKTRIHQESCNQDFTCLEGNCPSFVKVAVSPRQLRKQRRRQSVGRDNPIEKTWQQQHGRGDHNLRSRGERFEVAEKILAEATSESLPDPASIPVEASMLLAGIGGTGVVTASQVLATAALLEGKHCLGLDQTGLSQKGGQVISNLKITADAADVSNRIGAGQADTLLLFDKLAASDEAVLLRATAARTVAAISTSELPTGEMISDANVSFPDTEQLHSRIIEHTKSQIWVDAESLSRLFFKSQPPANIIVMGAAFQSGQLPLSAEAIEHAIEINGVAANVNIAAFRLGRAVAADQTLQAKLLAVEAGEAEIDDAEPKETKKSKRIAAEASSITAEGSLFDVLVLRANDLASYQSHSYAKLYLTAVGNIARREEASLKDTVVSNRLSLAVAKNLYKLMAYKDEYEVARLHLLPELRRQINDSFSPKAKVSFLLQPPIFTKLGLSKKIALPRWLSAVLFRLLRPMRKIRGTFLDVFGYAKERRLERRLIVEYIDIVSELSDQITPENYDLIVEIAELADMIRGYDTVKMASIDRYRNELTRKLSELLAISDSATETGAEIEARA